MKPTEIILRQMDHLNGIKTLDPEQACRIAETICKLAEQLPTANEETPVDIHDARQNISFKEACLFLNMGAASLEREIAADPEFPIFQPGGPKGIRYFTTAGLAEWKARKVKSGRKKRTETIIRGKVLQVD